MEVIKIDAREYLFFWYADRPVTRNYDDWHRKLSAFYRTLPGSVSAPIKSQERLFKKMFDIPRYWH